MAVLTNDNCEKPVFEAHFAGPGVAEAGSELPCFGRQKGKMFSYRREIPCYFWSGRNRVPLPCGTITFLFCLHLCDYKQNGLPVCAVKCDLGATSLYWPLVCFTFC